jgi:hypothetical protein
MHGRIAVKVIARTLSCAIWNVTAPHRDARHHSPSRKTVIMGMAMAVISGEQ